MLPMFFSRRFFAATCLLSLAVSGAMLGGCAVGPDYVRPQAPVPDGYRENFVPIEESEWRPAAPGELNTAPWWRAFDDPALDALMDRLEENNQDIQVALANLRLARAQVSEARASFFPTLGAGASRFRGVAAPGAPPATTYTAQLQAGWELDLWGGVRRSVESSSATAEASAATLGNVVVSMRGQLAQNYFQLRSLDEQTALYKETIAAYERSLAITLSQYNAGTVTKVDPAQAEAQLKATQAQAVDIDLQRRQMEHAIATLLGLPPAQFSIEPAQFSARLPRIAPVLPARLLERRPDIAAAERAMAAANAKIGMAESAFYPNLSFSVSGGYQGGILEKLFMVPNQIWSLGPSLALSLFQGGATLARTREAVASWDAAVAQYRKTVLSAFEEVENQLAAISLLEQEAGAQDDAVASSREAERLFLSQYKAGTVTYLSVVTAQTTALSNARSAVSIKGRRFIATVALVQAMGGGWDTTMLSVDGNPKEPSQQRPSQ